MPAASYIKNDMQRLDGNIEMEIKKEDIKKGVQFINAFFYV